MNGTMNITRRQLEALHQVERDMASATTVSELSKDRQIMHAILNSVDPQRHMSRIDLIIAFEQGDLDDDAVIELFQSLIDDGTVWHLQGSYGRMARSLIESGYCHPVRDSQGSDQS